MATLILNNEALKELKDIFDNIKIHNIQTKKISEENIRNVDTEYSNINSTENWLDILLEKVENYLRMSDKSSAEFIKLLAMKASLIYEKAKIKLFDELSSDALPMLQSTLELIEEYVDNNYLVFLNLRIINHLSYLLSKSGKLEEAKNLLENILYKEYNPSIVIYSTEDLFNLVELDPESSRIKFSKLMLNNIQMLGWIYGKLGVYDLHAFMEHLYLQKQLDLEDMSILQWTSKCCRLVTIYLTTYNWVYARYYLASISTLLQAKSDQSKANMEIPQAKADLSKAWIHYGLHLFSVSKKKLLEQIYDNDNESPAGEKTKDISEMLEQHKFNGLTVVVPNIPTNFITETQDARTLFIHTQNWLKQVRNFYTLRDYPLQYVNAVLDLSELYRFLAFYETDLESQYNVQRRRSETLEALSTLLREVRPNCYTAVSIELWRELAEVQLELMGINLKRLYTLQNERETPESIKQKMEAVYKVHDKLETIGDTIESAEYKKETLVESQENISLEES